MAKNADIIVVQVQNFQTNAMVPESIKPAALGMDLVQVTQHLVEQVKYTSPSTKLYLQFGFEVTDNPADILADIERVKGLGIDGIALWYNPGISGQTSKISLLQKVMEKIERHL